MSGVVANKVRDLGPTGTQPFCDVLGEPVRQLIDASRRMNEINASQARLRNRRFTLDGHIVGSIGEAIAALEFGVDLAAASTRGHDGMLDGRPVEVKATQVKNGARGGGLSGRVSFRGDLSGGTGSGDGRTDGGAGLLLIVLALHLVPAEDDPNWQPQWECIYGGDAARVADVARDCRRNTSNGQWSMSLTTLAGLASG